MSKLPDTICSAPFFKLELDNTFRFRPCCKFEGGYEVDEKFSFEGAWNSQDRKNLMKDFLDGKKPKQCRECWVEEELDTWSYRNHMLDVIPKSIIEQSLDGENIYPKSLDIKVSNLCNMKCRICGPAASSQIAKEFLKYNEISREDYDFFRDKKILTKGNIDTLKSWLPDIERIEITGGETFINPELFELLELCVETDNAKHITFHTNTNGTIFSEKLNKLFKEFKSTSIGFSIDDSDNRFEYQRDGGDWNEVEENLRNYQKLDLPKDFFINCTVSFLNVYYMPEFLQWCIDNKWYMGFNILFLPEFNHIGNIPRFIKDKVIEKYEKFPKFVDRRKGFNIDKLPKLIDMMNLVEVVDDSHFKYAWNEIKKVDERRNQKYSDSHPEFYKIIQEYINERV